MILADTSGLLALLDEGEPAHASCATAVASLRGPLLTSDFVLAETDFLIERRLGGPAARAFLDQVVTGAILREAVEAKDLDRARRILERYADQGFGLIDATLMTLAERLDAPVLTLDRRHFGVFRTEAGEPLLLLP